MITNEDLRWGREEFGLRVAVPDRVLASLEVSHYRDHTLRAVFHAITGYVASNRVWEEQRVTRRVLTWGERLRALLGGEVETAVRVTINHNCPHLPAAPDSTHAAFLKPLEAYDAHTTTPNP